MIAEKSQAVINRFGLTMGASAVGAKTAEAAGIINTGGGEMTRADWAVIVSIIGGSLYAANMLVNLYERLIELRAKRAAAGIKGTPVVVSVLAMAGAFGVLYACLNLVWWALA